jgi:hypothetical protein
MRYLGYAFGLIWQLQCLVTEQNRFSKELTPWNQGKSVVYITLLLGCRSTTPNLVVLAMYRACGLFRIDNLN